MFVTSDAGSETGPGHAPNGLEAANAVHAQREAKFRDAETELVELASHVAAATARILRRVVAMDRADLISAPDTIETWLAWRLSLPPRIAKNYVRVAYALEDLPKTAAALEAGELSFEKVSALTKIATPETEETLLGWATSGTAAQVEKIVSSYQRAAAAADLEGVNERYARRCLDHFFDEHGDFILRGCLPAEDGALVAKALEAYADNASEDGYMFGQKRADALVAMAQAALDVDFEKTPARADHYQVVVHVDEDALTDDASGGRSELFPDISINPETARRLTCDSPLIPLIERDGEPVSVGKKSRHIPTGTRRAMIARDRGCRWPGCTNDRWIDAHHIKWWLHGGNHDLPNLLSLCRRHHRMVHEGGYEVRRRPDGEPEFVHPSGRLVKASPPIGPPTTEFKPLNTATLVETYVDPCDYGLAVELLQLEARAAATAGGET